MKISTRSRYGLRFMAQLARHYGEGFIFLKDIAREEEISEKYLGQLIIPLKAKGLIASGRGAYGGYTLAKEPSAITVKEIVEILEGDISLVDCIKSPGSCTRVPFCFTRDVWMSLGKQISQTLGEMTLEKLIHNKLIEKESVVI